MTRASAVAVPYRLVAFGEAGAVPARDLAALHAALLPESPVAALGRRFMERFYYRVLPAAGLTFGALAYVAGSPAGFVVATHDSTGFMRAAVRQAAARLVWVILVSILLNPGSAREVAAAYRTMRHRTPIAGPGGAGEILSLGVLPAYREPRFVLESGLRISTDLVEYAVAQLRSKGVHLIRAIVAGNNTPAKLLYSGLGWTLNRTNVPEWSCPTAEFVWRA